MSKKISRRQFLNAVGVVAASQMLEGCGILKGLSLFKNRNLIGEHLCHTPCGDVQGVASSMAGAVAGSVFPLLPQAHSEKARAKTRRSAINLFMVVLLLQGFLTC